VFCQIEGSTLSQVTWRAWRKHPVYHKELQICWRCTTRTNQHLLRDQDPGLSPVTLLKSPLTIIILEALLVSACVYCCITTPRWIVSVIFIHVHTHDICSVHLGEGSSSAALQKGLDLFSHWTFFSVFCKLFLLRCEVNGQGCRMCTDCKDERLCFWAIQINDGHVQTQMYSTEKSFFNPHSSFFLLNSCIFFQFHWTKNRTWQNIVNDRKKNLNRK